MAGDRPHSNAMDYYRDNETDFRDPDVVAMLALTDALIDHRKAIVRESDEICAVLNRCARTIASDNDGPGGMH